MGIGDFGVTGTGPAAVGYAYSSPVFEGQAVVRSMSVTISGSSSKVTAFELNAVLFLQRGGQNYSYWIQNGLHLDASSDEFTIGGAYVWNFSSPSAKLSVGEVQGNASSVLSGDTYYFIPACVGAFAGQCTKQTLPVTLTGRIVSATSAGIPYVAYQYDLGNGWVTYDNVSFPRLVGANDSGFLVDGFVHPPIAPSLFYVAEWDWVGAGGGSASVDQASDIGMSLEFWNGHDYQRVPNAWNFGGNTGETASNVSDTLAAGTGPQPEAHLVSGSGSLGVLYNQSTVGFLNLTAPTNSTATLLVDGESTAFEGGALNLTLLAGDHHLYLENYTNASANVTIPAGGTTRVDLVGAGLVTFRESGLPVGTRWGVSLNGTARSTSNVSLSYHLTNGSYSLDSLAVPGYRLNGTLPTVLTLPGSTQFDLEFVPFTYSVTFTESGLPSATVWWVTVAGTRVQGSTPSLGALLPNGSSPYATGSAYEFVATPSSGTVTVTDGLSSPVEIEFAYRPTFIAGSVTPQAAQVTVAGAVQAVFEGAFNASVIPGTYLVSASATGFASQSVEVTATAGNVSWANFSLVADQTPPPVGSNGSNQSPAGSSGISTQLAVALIAVVAVAAVAALVVVVRRRGPAK